MANYKPEPRHTLKKIHRELDDVLAHLIGDLNTIDPQPRSRAALRVHSGDLWGQALASRLVKDGYVLQDSIEEPGGSGFYRNHYEVSVEGVIHHGRGGYAGARKREWWKALWQVVKIIGVIVNAMVLMALGWLTWRAQVGDVPSTL
ncbi:MAG TPA: hypothetical protein PK760_11340 [Flavobacteriales bacterium]|nr:hypothetical protein [Flavobacteriales bacterium]